MSLTDKEILDSVAEYEAGGDWIFGDEALLAFVRRMIAGEAKLAQDNADLAADRYHKWREAEARVAALEKQLRDQETSAVHSGASAHREWHTVGEWLYPGDRIVTYRPEKSEQPTKEL